MRHLENNDNATTPVANTQQFEKEFAFWLDEFDYQLDRNPKAQPLLYSCIESTEDDCLSIDEKRIAKAFLGVALKLSFIVKQNPQLVKKYIEYHTD